MDLEQWVTDLFKEIEIAAEKNESYDLHLTNEMVQDMAAVSRNLNWIEIN